MLQKSHQSYPQPWSSKYKRCWVVGGRVVQTQMLLEVGPNMHQQILILPPCPTRATAGQCQGTLVGLGPRLQPKECGFHRNLFAHPPELDISRLDHSPVSGPGSQHQPSPDSGYLHRGHSAWPHSLGKALLCEACFQGTWQAFPPSPLYLPRQVLAAFETSWK